MVTSCSQHSDNQPTHGSTDIEAKNQTFFPGVRSKLMVAVRNGQVCGRGCSGAHSGSARGAMRMRVSLTNLALYHKNTQVHRVAITRRWWETAMLSRLEWSQGAYLRGGSLEASTGQGTDASAGNKHNGQGHVLWPGISVSLPGCLIQLSPMKQ